MRSGLLNTRILLRQQARWQRAYPLPFSHDTQEERDKFERLFHQYERCLKYTAQNILFDEHLAEDAVQETFIRIISCLDKIDESDEHKTIAFLITVIKIFPTI